MSKFVKRLNQFVQDEDGATMVEYGLMLALIAIVCTVAVTGLGIATESLFTRNGNAVANSLG